MDGEPASPSISTGSGPDPDYGSGWGDMPPPEPLQESAAAAAVPGGTTTTTATTAAGRLPDAGFEVSSLGGQDGEGAASSLNRPATTAGSGDASGLPEASSSPAPPFTGDDDYDLWGSPSPGTLDENEAGARGDNLA